MKHCDVLVLGGGAAGLYFAAEAGRTGKSTVVLEGNSDPGRKILISGGGRCNFTNLYTAPENFLSENPHFMRSALARYTPHDFISLVDKYRIPWHEKKLGQLFCDGSARAVVDMLLAECAVGAVDIRLGAHITEVRRSVDQFIVVASSVTYAAPSLVVATGGLSIPKIGATGLAYDVARQFGLRVVDPRPALVPLVLSQQDQRQWCDLAGVAADVEATFGAARFCERMLVTHRGLSGPAVLQISSYWDGRGEIEFDLLGGRDLPRAGDRSWKNALTDVLPRRFAERWLENTFGLETRVSATDVEDRLRRWKVTPDGTEGYAKAEVTAGGVDTRDLSSKTMEARNVPGLFFIGEAVDVTGHLGGFNFQWAWASAAAAARSL